MRKLSVLYILACHFVLTCACLAGLVFALHKMTVGGLVGFYEEEAILFAFIALWSCAGAVGTMRKTRWGWVLSFLLGFFMLAASGLGLLIDQGTGFGFDRESRIGAGTVVLCAAGWLVSLFLPGTFKQVRRSPEFTQER